MTRVGRRPGKRDTRAEILAAARACFTDQGYEDTSLRAIARKAGVDPALIYHYFEGKAGLFAAVLQMPRDPRAVAEQARQEGGPEHGGPVVESFLAQWEQADDRNGNPRGTAFLTVMQAACASPQAAENLRQFINERVWSTAARNPGEDDETFALRRALVSSQLVGLAWARYILRLDPVSTADPHDVGVWAGPTIERYTSGPLEAQPTKSQRRRRRHRRASAEPEVSDDRGR